MALEFAVLAIVTAMLTWVIQVENGGLLNVLFEKVPGTLQDSPQFDITTNIKYDFFTSMLLLKPLPLPILNAMPEALGGGQAGVKNANAHPNREALLFWITVGLLLFVAMLIIGIQIYSCGCCKFKNTAALRTKSRLKRLVFRIIFIILMIIELLLVAASVYLLVVYFHSVDSVVFYLKVQPPASSKPTHTPTSLSDGLQAVLTHTANFFHEGIQSGRMHTDTLAKAFINLTKERAVSELDKSIDGLLRSFKVSEVLNASNSAFLVHANFALHAQNAIQSMYIAQSGARNLSTTATASMQLIDKALGNFFQCNQTPPCPELKNATAQLIGFGDFESLNITVIEEVMQTLNSTALQLHTFQNKVSSAIDAAYNSTSDIILSLEREINIDRFFTSLDNFWADVDRQANDIIHRLRLATNSFTKQLKDTSGPILITLYCIGGCLTLMILIATIGSICMIHQVTRNHLPSSGLGKSKDRTERVVCGKCSICCCSMLLLPTLFAFSAVIAVSLFALTVASSEGCTYVMQETGINKTDFILNGYVAHHWKSLIRGVGGGGGDVTEFVVTAPPKNALFALTKTCHTKAGQRGVGLLSALGYSNLVNTSRIVSSSAVTQAIAKARETVLQELDRVNIPQTLPDVALIARVKAELANAMANFTLASFLDPLDSTSINATEATHLMDLLTVLVESNATANKDEFLTAKASLGEVVKEMDEFKALANSTRESICSIAKEGDELVASFHTALTAFLGLLELGRNKSALMAEAEKQYDAVAVGLTEFVQVEGDGLFAQLTQELLPCGKAHAAYAVATQVTCGESGGVNRLLGLVCILAFNIVFLVLLHFGLFCLAQLQTLQVRLLGSAASEVGWSDEETSTTTSGSSNK
ncbi:hypothetical protein TcWFU_001241 [Taenia crassiceps]|uniref:Uncharacterized protein n=1 Tax=Taenia crassiceps TaxID=6207 RepID=A0ABR4Q2F2_9CEST